MLSVATLSSCVSEMPFEQELAKANKGLMELNVNLQKPATRATSEVTDFPVAIYNADGKALYNYNTVAEVPASITMEVGTYVVESHTPGVIAKRMSTPYYQGSESVEILKGITTKAEVTCKMKNSKISVGYDADFLSTFTSWEVTVDDGSGTALSFTNGDPTSSVYWFFGEEGAKELTVNFRGTTKEGSTVAARNILTKDQASEHYDDDHENFSGGDAITITFTPTESTDGKVSNITITASVVFEESNKTINVNVVDVTNMDDSGDETPGGGSEGPSTGGETEDAITLTMPKPITLSADDAATADPSSGDVKMEATNGIKSILVKVDSKSDEMMEQLAAVADQYAGVDLVNGCEVVANNNLVAFLASLGKEITVPTQGDTEYTFPVGQFYLFLGILPGEHNFVMTITDMNGATKSGTIKVTITE